MANVYVTMKKRHESLLKMISEIEQKLDHMPEGYIYLKNLNRKSYFYMRSGKAEQKYLSSKDEALTRQLVQKDYLKKSLRSAKKEAEALENAIGIYPQPFVEGVFDRLPEAKKKYAEPLFPGADEIARKWLAQLYVPKPIGKDTPVYLTIKGERVRSKSEVIIADRLWANGIPYKYECPILVRDEIIHPDFTILRLSDLKILYHEHLGKLDDPQYTERNNIRINSYNEEGIILGDRLFLSFETSKTPLDVRVIDNLINTHFR